MPTYTRLPVTFTHGEGVWLFDDAGRRYLDALAGIAVNTLGHAHPRLVVALQDQIGKLIHTSNLYSAAWQERLATKLATLCGQEQVFFCNSGLEANEAALKLARLWGHGKGIAMPEIVVFDHAFHGRSIATLSATGNQKIQKGFEPLVPGFRRIALNDLKGLQALAGEANICAVFLEAVQGEGGIRPAEQAFLQGARALCDEQGWLLMIDEVQCGMGRTGQWFAHQWAGIRPDVVAMAKGLASGVPIGAVLTQRRFAFSPGQHGSTFGGNPLACRAALETITVLEEEGLLDEAARVGNFLQETLRQALAGVEGVVEIRGRGLMVGIELDRPCGALVAQALEVGLLINVTQEKVIRLLPPLIFRREHVNQLVDTLVPLIRHHLAS